VVLTQGTPLNNQEADTQIETRLGVVITDLQLSIALWVWFAR